MGLPDFSERKVDRYLLKSAIGSGTSGNIYYAVDTTSRKQRSFAVKCLPKDHHSTPRWVQVADEIINHDTVTGCPHVLPMYDIVEERNMFFLIFPLCETDMFRAIWYGEVYWHNDRLIRKAFLELLDGVGACHDRHIFHRDLKPENLMCNADGTGILIGDFGLATHHRICRDGGCGSRSYISPECWQSRKGDAYSSSMSDIWALGMILFNMVTSTYPWGAALPSDTGYKTYVRDRNYLFKTSIISQSLSELLKRMLDPDPRERWESISTIRKAVLGIDTFYKRDLPEPKLVAFTSRADLNPAQTSVKGSVRREKKKNAKATTSIWRLVSQVKSRRHGESDKDSSGNYRIQEL